MAAFKKYNPRSIQFLGLWTPDGWNIKIYNICETVQQWNVHYIDVAKSIATGVMLKLPLNEHHHTGFLTIHVAGMFNQIIFDWWARENELRHLVFKAHADTPYTFRDITSSGEAFCVWELKVITHERDSWLKHVLKNHSNPGFRQYLADTLDTVE